MFMFRSRRNALLKRLWRLAAFNRAPDSEDDAEHHHHQQHQQQQQHEHAEHDERVKSWIKSAAHALFKRLSDDQLALLVEALDGAAASPCLWLDSDLVNRSSPEGAHRLLCRIFRWPDLPARAELKRIVNLCTEPPTTTTTHCSSNVCCNPHHWSRLSQVVPPPFSRLALTSHDTPRRVPGSNGVASFPVESLETGGTNQYSTSYGSHIEGGGTRTRPWCTLAYWELKQRVGRLFPVNQSSVAIFSENAPLGECAVGLCLAALAAQIAPETDAVRRTRQKVGSGLLLCKEADGVWMYNRSENAVFVNSPTLDPPGPAGAPRTLLVYKVPPSYAIRVFDYERSAAYQMLQQQQCNGNGFESHSPSPPPPPANGPSLKWTDAAGADVYYSDGPFDPNALRISFAKGWGPKYSRQFITSCPCWIEVLLAPR